MNYAYQTDKAVTDLLKFKIGFSSTYKSYIFQNKWTNTFTESYFQEQVVSIKKLLHLQLKNGLNQTEYLQNLLDQIWKRIEWIQDKKAYLPEFFKLYNKIVEMEVFEEKLSSNKDKFQKFLKNDYKLESPDFDLFNYLRFYSEEMNTYRLEIDFEKGLLLHVISLYHNALDKLYNYIYSIHINAEYTDFKNFNFEDLEQSSTKTPAKRLCHVNFDKKSIAHLFRILIDENIFVFDVSNERKNNFEMKNFVEENFTYQNEKKRRMPIKNFNREYSETVSYLEENKQREILNKFINILELRRNRLDK